MVLPGDWRLFVQLVSGHYVACLLPSEATTSMINRVRLLKCRSHQARSCNNDSSVG